MNDQAQQLRELMTSNHNELMKKKTQMKVITVASGKGGVGKSNFSVNTALALKAQNKRPIILDADFGLANVEIILGEAPKYNLGHLINDTCTIKEVVTMSKYGIPFISGGSGIREMMFLSPAKIDKISRALSELEEMGDVLIVDTGAGINDVVVKFSKFASEVYIVITPEPTSITDGYALIKTLISQFAIDTSIKIVINKAISKEEAQGVFNKLSYVVNNFLGVKISYAGFIPYDDKLFMAVKEQIPITIYDKRAKSSMAYKEVSKSILGSEDQNNIHAEGWLQRFKNIFS